MTTDEIPDIPVNLTSRKARLYRLLIGIFVLVMIVGIFIAETVAAFVS